MSIVLDFRRWRGKSLGRCSFRAFHLRHSLVYSLKLNVSSDKHEHSRSRDQQPERTCLLVTCYAMYHLMQHAWWKMEETRRHTDGQSAIRKKHMQAPLAGWTEALVSVGRWTIQRILLQWLECHRRGEAGKINLMVTSVQVQFRCKILIK